MEDHALETHEVNTESPAVADEYGADHGRPHPHTVAITVNGHPVTVPSPKATGHQIKQAAIRAGIAIQIDFVLSVVRPNGDAAVVGDDEELTVNKNTKCVALAPDDNS